jgi:purine-nucleoside phosphorylase
MTGAPASGIGAATTSVGMRCTDCPGTTITGGAINGVAAATTVAGLWVSGNVAGLSVTGTNISGGQVITAAAGALNEKYHVGDFIFLSDMITAFCSSPLKGAQFQDLSEVFDLQWRHKAVSICATQEIPVHEGVYVYTKGPHFETPADKMSFHHLGADVVGMSTVPETIMARWLKLKVLGLAYVTNLAFVTHDHKDVLAAAEQGSDRMVTLLKNL